LAISNKSNVGVVALQIAEESGQGSHHILTKYIPRKFSYILQEIRVNTGMPYNLLIVLKVH
jgi:hypothetical protein